MFLTLNPSDFWQFRSFIGLIIDNHNNIVNNLNRFVFLEYPNRYPNWVAHLGTQRFQLTLMFVIITPDEVCDTYGEIDENLLLDVKIYNSLIQKAKI